MKGIEAREERKMAAERTEEQAVALRVLIQIPRDSDSVGVPK